MPFLHKSYTFFFLIQGSEQVLTAQEQALTAQQAAIINLTGVGGFPQSQAAGGYHPDF